MSIKFKDMNDWDTAMLKQHRGRLKNILVAEIHKREAIKAEILFLQTKIEEIKS